MGDMGSKLQTRARFVHAEVAINSQPEHAQIDRAIGGQAVSKFFAFQFRSFGIASDSKVPFNRKAKGFNQELSKLHLTGSGIVHCDAAPFVELHNAERLKRALIA